MKTYLWPPRSVLFKRLFAARFIFLCVMVVTPTSAIADKFASIGSGWQRYSNDLYGTEFEFPVRLFKVSPAPASGEGRRFISRDATLEIFATRNVEGETARALKQRLLGEEEGYEAVTYAPSGRNWLVISGFRGDRIFYEKYLLRDGFIHAFGIEFPASAKPVYAPIIERIEDSFEVGTPASATMVRDATSDRRTDSSSEPADDPLVIYE